LHFGSDPKVNWRTTFQKIIARAGLKAWPRLFHNLRASCATDWVERFPAHAVASWCGHSVAVAVRHYLQTRDAHFDLAAGIDPSAEAPAPKPVQNPVQIPGHIGGARERTHAPAENKNPPHGRVVRVGAPSCAPGNIGKVGDTGFEPVTSSMSRKRASQLR
jgi:hypothetical protein